MSFKKTACTAVALLLLIFVFVGFSPSKAYASSNKNPYTNNCPAKNRARLSEITNEIGVLSTEFGRIFAQNIGIPPSRLDKLVFLAPDSSKEKGNIEVSYIDDRTDYSAADIDFSDEPIIVYPGCEDENAMVSCSGPCPCQ